MSVQGFINRIRRQVGLPAVPPNIAADELPFDPVAGLFYYMPDGGERRRSFSTACSRA